MKYWTVQDVPAWEEAQRVGYLTGSHAHIYEYFVAPYDWLVQQMKQRLGIGYDFYPVWMWTTRPDLRERGFAEKGAPSVLLEIELDPALVLLSDYGTWHAVLNWHALTAHEDEVIDMEKSWERVFDFELLRSDREWWGDVTEQATTPRVPVANIKVLRYFIGR